MMAEPLMSFDISKQRRRGSRSALPPRPPNAWILYRSDKMREIQRERKTTMLSNNNNNDNCKPRNPSSSSSSSSTTNNITNQDYPFVQIGSFMKDSDGGGSGTIKSLSPKNVDRIDENGGGANCLQAQISRMVSQMWKSESEQVKEHYAKLAAEHKLEHQRQYPNYRYQPKRRNRLSLPTPTTNDSYNLQHYHSGRSEQHPDGHYNSVRGGMSRYNTSWSSWQNPWNGGSQGQNPYDSPLTLQQIGPRPTFRGSSNNPHEKRSQSDGIYTHPLMPQNEQQRYTSLPTTNATTLQTPSTFTAHPPTTRSNGLNNGIQNQQYPITQPAYVTTQMPINSQQSSEGSGNRTYSDNLSSIHLQQQQPIPTTYASDQPMYVPISHSQLYDGGLRRISPSSHSSNNNPYSSISPDLPQQLQLQPINNQRNNNQQMPEMDMLQSLLANGNTNTYTGTPAFPK